MNVKNFILASIVSTTLSCQSIKKEYTSFDSYPVREGDLTEMEYSPAETKFYLWSPVADEVKVLLYKSGKEGSAFNTIAMTKGDKGVWTATVEGDLNGTFYTYQLQHGEKTTEELRQEVIKKYARQ